MMNGDQGYDGVSDGNVRWEEDMDILSSTCLETI